MVRRAGEPQRSANTGELSPEAAGRMDIRQYWAAGIRYKNIEPVPLSGFRQMDGTVDTGAVRGRVATTPVSNVVTDAGPHTGTVTLWEADLDEGSVVAIDAAALAVTAGTATVTAQAYVGGVWQDINVAFSAGQVAAATTFAMPPGGALLATKVRLRATLTTPATASTGTVTVLKETTTQDQPRYNSLQHDGGDRYFMSLQSQFMDIYLEDDFKAGIYLPSVTSDLVSTVDFYSELATIGIFERNMVSQRVRRVGSATAWTRDLWPYVNIPTADLGGTYAKTDDVWEVTVRWSLNSVEIYLQVTVDGETIAGVPFVDSAGNPSTANGGFDYALTASNLETALRALPSLSDGVTVAYDDISGPAVKFTVTFGGDLSGVEYQVDATITNTAQASALASHISIGKTDYEPLFSETQGWPGAVGTLGDRQVYHDIKAIKAAIVYSRTAEYFDTNIEAAGESAARFDKLRGGQVVERILAVTEAVYPLIFTSRNAYFIPNRAITAKDPLTYSPIAKGAIVPNCAPLRLGTKVYYVADDIEDDTPSGHQVFSLSYSEIQSTFEPNPESLLSDHLIKEIRRTAEQDPGSKKIARRGWFLRSDGRLIGGFVIETQEILGFAEFVPADTGKVREIHVDRRNRLRMCIERGGKLRHERQEAGAFLHGIVTSSADFTGKVHGLDIHNGRQVYAIAQGFVLGPFTVSGGAIDLGDVYIGDITVGLWQPPVWESCPKYLLLPGEKILKRPGAIKAAHVEVIDTTSIAIGANGQPAENVPLQRFGQVGDAPLDPFTGEVSRYGMLGLKQGTTIVITQTRPGQLQVRDLVTEEKL